ncbi:MAG: extracellular solute-binding protein [Spirochaetia bacterium]|nr:extracellular solute-binding protein [Spirochaetia bacterium]
MLRKLFFVAMVICFLVPGLVFASGDQEESADSGGIISPETQQTIDMMGWRYPITEFYAKELEKSNSVKNLRVNTQLLDSGSAKEQVRLALSGSGESPYEIVHADDALVIELASEGWLMPLDDLIEKYKDQYDLDDISEAMYNLGSYNGKIYGIPIVANSMNYFYNMELFDKYDLEVPDTYDDVIATAEVLKQEESIDLPFTINLHAGWAWRIEFHNFLKASGGKWLNDDNTPAFNSPEGVKAVEKMIEVYEACMGEGGLTWSIDDSEIGMETGTLASCMTWTSRAANMDDPEKSLYVGKIGFAPAPRVVEGGPHAGPAAADFYCIPANVEVDPELIFQVIMEAADLESQKKAAEEGMVTRSAVAEAGVGGRYLAAAQQTIANGAGNYGPNPAGKLARTAIENILPTVVRDETTVKGVLDKAAELYIEEAKKQGFIN